MFLRRLYFKVFGRTYYANVCDVFCYDSMSSNIYTTRHNAKVAAKFLMDSGVRGLLKVRTVKFRVHEELYPEEDKLHHLKA